jgi:hypothetical protein
MILTRFERPPISHPRRCAKPHLQRGRFRCGVFASGSSHEDTQRILQTSPIYSLWTKTLLVFDELVTANEGFVSLRICSRSDRPFEVNLNLQETPVSGSPSLKSCESRLQSSLIADHWRRTFKNHVFPDKCGRINSPPARCGLPRRGSPWILSIGHRPTKISGQGARSFLVRYRTLSMASTRTLLQDRRVSRLKSVTSVTAKSS